MWWFWNIGEKCNMRIGFRYDEFNRMLRFFNNSDPVNFSIPVSCSTRGKKLQRHENFNWRFVEMPLIKDGIENVEVKSFWANKYVGGNSLFDGDRRKIEFPEISNCVGCFHKLAEIIMLEWILNPELIEWFARQEDKGMGTWHDSRIPYWELIEQAKKLTAQEIEFLKIKYLNIDGNTCDVGGCTD